MNFENWRLRVQLTVPGWGRNIGRVNEASQNLADRSEGEISVDWIRFWCASGHSPWHVNCSWYGRHWNTSMQQVRLCYRSSWSDSVWRKEFQCGITFNSSTILLANSGAEFKENDLVSQLFLTLPDSYDVLVTALENNHESDLTQEMVNQRLLSEELKQDTSEDT